MTQEYRMNLKEKLLKRGFVIVYQSGHSDTFCNKDVHIHLGGGTVGIREPSINDFLTHIPYSCNCEKYKK